ncbi:hypothetical protein O3P69_011714 [Scylla paramamosain]|uniref:PiggyBac transposable element-derived protein domain-containing protein n=1 Tax=Scylla paramamosain TaxID=85552 RepID=A0AAW0SAP6_SCYPA
MALPKRHWRHCSGESGSEESVDELEQIGAESVSVASVQNTLPRITTSQSFPAFPVTSDDESDEGHVDDPGRENESRSETKAERCVAPNRRCRSPCHQTTSPTPSSSTHSSPTPSSSTPSLPTHPSSAFTASHPSPPRRKTARGRVLGARRGIRGGRRGARRGVHDARGMQPQQVRHDLFDFVWEDGENFDSEPLVFDNSEAGVQAEFPCTATSSVLQFFTAFFDLAVMQYLVWEINCFREISVRWLAPLKVPKESKMKAWTDVSVEELYVWFALTMLMPHVKKHVLQDYWIVGDLISTPSFGKWMPRDRYLLILRYLHFTNNYGPKPIDRLWKVDRLKAWEWMSRHKLALLPHLPSGRKGSRRCHVCANTTRKAPARKETQYWCLECKVPLCPGCYSDYHSLENF